jgi:D-alanyl-D-alanine carboxypeptidase
MKYLHFKFTIIITFLFVVTLSSVGPVGTAFANKKYASIVVDAETGKVLRSRNASKKLHPASLTKIMTLYMVFDALSRGQIKLTDRIPISRRANGMEPSKLGLPVGSSIKVSDAVYALVTKSANDVAVAIGEKLAGSEWAFAKRMTTKARALGMKNTTFRNASGLPDAKQISTARDMAILGRALIYNHPQYYHYFSTKNFSYRGKSYRNHNRLMTTYKGMDGIKTGYIHASGFNLVASAVRDNRRLIAVVFGGRTSKTRNAHMEKIMDEGFHLARKLPKTRVASLGMGKPVQSPKPLRKPQTLDYVLASLTKQAEVSKSPNAIIDGLVKKPGRITELLGQGDLDPDESERLRSSLMTMAIHTRRRIALEGIGEFDGTQVNQVRKNIQSAVLQDSNQNWAVQIGAYSSEQMSGQAIRVASKSLPPELRKTGQANTVPLVTGSRTIYRARMEGFNEFEAQKACAYLRNCMVIAP